MMDFQHPNVMSLIGVCLDAGPGVSIVMPFMANGRVSNRKSKSMQNEFFSVFSSGSILDMMETTPQISEAPENVCETQY